MKLVGSKMEDDFREELISSNEGLNSIESELGEALKSKGYNTKKAFVLHWTPEQLEDIYIVLVNRMSLVSVEIDKHDLSKPPVFEEMELKEYTHGLSRMNQVRLAVAQDLVNG